MAEAVRGRVALTCHQCGAVGSAGVGREARARGEGFLLGQEGEKPPWDRSGRGNIMCSHTLHMTLVYVTTPSFPVYRDV